MKRYMLYVFLFLALLLSGCATSAFIDPDEDIKEQYAAYEQLVVQEANTRRVYLLKQDDTYLLAQYRKEGNGYTFDSLLITTLPYRQLSKTVDDTFYLTFFIDNSIVNASRYEIDIRNFQDAHDKLTLSLDHLQQLDTYIIKTYTFPYPYQTIGDIRIYDQTGKCIITFP